MCNIREHETDLVDGWPRLPAIICQATEQRRVISADCCSADGHAGPLHTWGQTASLRESAEPMVESIKLEIHVLLVVENWMG